MGKNEALNGEEIASESSSHLNPVAEGTNLAMLALIEREQLRAYLRRALGFFRDLQTVLGGSVLADLIKDGELVLDPLARS